MDREKDIFVVVADGDKHGAIVFEQEVNTATFKNALEKAKRLSPEYGKCRIAKLVFLYDINK